MAAGARCFGDGDPLYERYHDLEWGRPVTDERGLFERLCLEAFQAGLSWRLVLERRDRLRVALHGFDVDTLAGLDGSAVDGLLGAPGMIRNRAKVSAVLVNARATVRLRTDGGLPALIWMHAPPPRPAPRTPAELPAVTDASRALARTLRGLGFVFVGPTTAYATMQAAGLVNDHLASCPVRAEVEAEQTAARGTRAPGQGARGARAQ